MRILVGWTDDVSPNLGVRALGRGSRDLLSGIWPDAEFEYMNYGMRPSAVPWAPRSLLRERVTGRLGMMDWLRGFDLFWDTRSGDSFADIYGKPRHRTMSLIHEMVVRAGVPAALAPQTIGPFHGWEARALARRTLHRSKLVLARDPLSAVVSERLGRPADATTTDLVFGISQPEPESGHDVLLNVSGLLWNSDAHGNGERYRSHVRRIIDGLIDRGRTVSLLPHVLDSADPDNDVPTSRALQEQYEGSVGLVVPRDLDHVRAVIAGSNLVIGARMHACLNALSTGIPAVAMAYSQKFAPLMATLGWPHVVPLSGTADVAQQVLTAVDDPDTPDRARETQREGQRLLQLASPLLARLA